MTLALALASLALALASRLIAPPALVALTITSVIPLTLPSTVPLPTLALSLMPPLPPIIALSAAVPVIPVIEPPLPLPLAVTVVPRRPAAAGVDVGPTVSSPVLAPPLAVPMLAEWWALVRALVWAIPSAAFPLACPVRRALPLPVSRFVTVVAGDVPVVINQVTRMPVPLALAVRVA
jgi:hypothetical protein